MEAIMVNPIIIQTIGEFITKLRTEGNGHDQYFPKYLADQLQAVFRDLNVEVAIQYVPRSENSVLGFRYHYDWVIKGLTLPSNYPMAYPGIRGGCTHIKQITTTEGGVICGYWT